MLRRIGIRIVAVIVALGWGFPPAQAAPPPIEAYGALPRIESMDLSPSGDRLARVQAIDDKRLLVVETLDGKQLFRGDVGELKVADLQWAGDDFVALFTHVTSLVSMGAAAPQEFLQGLIVNVPGRKVMVLFKDSRNFVGAVFGRYGFVQEDGRWYGYFGAVPLNASVDRTRTEGSFKQSFPNLYRVDLETGQPTLVDEGSSRQGGWVIDAAGNITASSKYEPEDGQWTVYAGRGRQKPIASGQAAFGMELEGLGRTPDSVILGQNSEEKSVQELRLDGALSGLPLPPGEVEGLLYSSWTHLLSGAIVAQDRPKMIMFDPLLQTHMETIERAFAGQTLRVVSVSADSSRLIVYVEGPQSPGTYQLVDFRTGKSTPLADAYPDIPDQMVGPVSIFEYQASDGFGLQGVLTLPPGRDPHGLPVVVLPHGGPAVRDYLQFDWWAQAFAGRGYAVFQPNFRGSAGFGTAFRNAGFGQWGRKMQTDVSDGLAALAARGIVDPRQACIVGGSYGGYVALAGVTLQHGLYRCAVSVAGVSDLKGMLQNVSWTKGRERRAAPLRYWHKFMGVEVSAEVPDTLSPINLAARADAPILLIHGKDDTVVPIGQSAAMKAALARAGKQVEFVQLNSEDHWLSRSRTRIEMLKAAVAFVERNNPPGPSATPVR